MRSLSLRGSSMAPKPATAWHRGPRRCRDVTWHGPTSHGARWRKTDDTVLRQIPEDSRLHDISADQLGWLKSGSIGRHIYVIRHVHGECLFGTDRKKVGAGVRSMVAEVFVGVPDPHGSGL